MKNIFYLSLFLIAAFVSLSHSAQAQTGRTTATSTNATSTIALSATDAAAVARVLAAEGGSCEYLSDYILAGRANNVEDVYKLQAYLHIQEKIDVSFNGVFDEATRNGVKLMQERHAKEILAPWGITSATGNVYITTKNFLDEWSCGRNIPFTADETRILNAPRTSSSVIGRAPAVSGAAGTIVVSPVTTSAVSTVSPRVTASPKVTPGGGVANINTGSEDTDVFGTATDTDATSSATTSAGWLKSAKGSTILIIIVLAAIIYFIISMLSRTKTPNTGAQNENNNQNRNQNQGKK